MFGHQAPIRGQDYIDSLEAPLAARCLHSPEPAGSLRSDHQSPSPASPVMTQRLSSSPIPSGLRSPSPCNFLYPSIHRRHTPVLHRHPESCLYPRQRSPSPSPPIRRRRSFSEPRSPGCYCCKKYYDSIRCGHCDQPVYYNERVFSLQYPWHQSCLICVVCGKKLSPGKHAVTQGFPICQYPCMSAYLSGYQYIKGSKDARP